VPRKKLVLPDDEVRYLRSLRDSRLHARVRELYAGGWSLSSIAEALDPPRPRSTIHFWVSSSPPPSSSSSSSSLISAAEESHEHSRAVPPTSSSSSSSPSPRATPKPRRVTKDKHRRVFNPREPRLSSDDSLKIALLAPIARRYRSRANPLGQYARANDELTYLCKLHYSNGVSITELAAAAGVTYKAMERRVLS
jgi:hypothetical protein